MIFQAFHFSEFQIRVYISTNIEGKNIWHASIHAHILTQTCVYIYIYIYIYEGLWLKFQVLVYEKAEQYHKLKTHYSKFHIVST